MGNLPADQPAWLDQPPPGAPAPPMPPSEPAPESEMPAWLAPQPKSSRLWIYLTGVLLIVVIGGGGLWLRGQFDASTASDEYVTSTPKSLLSDHERADRFVNVQLTPAFAALVTPLQNVGKDCSPKTMVPACKPDLVATNQALIAGDTAIQQGDVPVCIGPQVSQLKFDWQGLEQGVGLAISGYNDGSYDLYLQGMVKFVEIAQYIKPDVDRITSAETVCSATPG